MPPVLLRLTRNYALFTLSFVALVLVLGVAERFGLPNPGSATPSSAPRCWSRRHRPDVPNDGPGRILRGRAASAGGVPTAWRLGADWMARPLSSASQARSMCRALMAWPMCGWTGGWLPGGLLLAPYRAASASSRWPTSWPAALRSPTLRLLSAAAVILVSFIYLVAQIYGVGLSHPQLTGLTFEVGRSSSASGVLVCSFLGGMRAVTWTQVAQYLIMILAYLVPVIWLSVKQTGWPVPQLHLARQLQIVAEREQALMRDPAELQVQEIHAQQAGRRP